MFFGYYLSAATMAREENGPAVPELARRMTLCSCRLDPARALVPVLTRMPAAGIPLGDILADSGYAHRVAAAWAIPLRLAGASLVQDLHPHDRGPREPTTARSSPTGTSTAPPRPSRCCNSARCPAAPPRANRRPRPAGRRTRPPQARPASPPTTPTATTASPAPPSLGKIRCPLRPESMTLDRDRPEILTPPEHPPACCTQQTITVGPGVAAKTRQKHDYPSPAHRHSYARRTGAERTFSTIKDPATTSIARGWCRLTGLPRSSCGLACLLTVRNQRILTAFHARQADNARRAAAGLPAQNAQRNAAPPPPRHSRQPSPRHSPATRANQHASPAAAPRRQQPRPARRHDTPSPETAAAAPDHRRRGHDCQTQM